MEILVQKSVKATIAATIVALSIYMSFEPTVSSAISDTVNVSLMVSSQITLSTATDTTFSRALDITAPSAIASVYWNVVTNNVAGYTLQVRNSSTSPALKNVIDASDGHFADYTPASAGVTETWSVPPGSKEFGFSAYGSNTSGYGTESGGGCGASHVPSATLKYRDLSTTNVTIASSTATTSLSGVNTTVCFAVEQDATFAADGTYVAEITATANTN